ncbi:MAG: mechanosensitive ion channel family protein [Pseudolabrys sp.]|jgi:small-conductance mechanosensitive channel
MDSVRSGLSTLAGWFDWLPDPLAAIAIVAFAVAVALSLHKTVRRLLRATFATRFPYALTVMQQMRGVTRLGLIILALSISVPVAPFDSVTADWIARLLLIAVIAMIGWMAMTALKIGADLYLLQYRIDTDDNLLARKHYTQVRVLLRTVDVLVLIITASAALMTFEPVRQYGVSLFASAGVAGLVAGFAARPVLSNLFAGVQLAVTQPIRIDDAVIVENEWGWVEEITSTYVVLRLWDWRRMIVPLTYFIEKPFQNWTRENSALIGTSMIYVDYRAPVAAIRARLEQIAKASPLWDGKVVNLQVTDCRNDTIELRCLVSASSAPKTFDLRCEVREKLVDFLQREHPEALPRQRADLVLAPDGALAGPQAPQEHERTNNLRTP